MQKDYIIPSLGSYGYYELRAPFDSVIVAYEKYTCKAIRKLSDLLANNENPKADIYDKYSIDESIYNEHIAEDIAIVSLQSDVGHWLFVPVTYFATYPIPNGIPYRAVSLVFNLPSLPVAKDLSTVEESIKNLITDSLGVVSKSAVVEQSRVVLVPEDKHIQTQAARNQVINGNVTDRSRYIKALQELQTAHNKIAELEAYILTLNS